MNVAAGGRRPPSPARAAPDGTDRRQCWLGSPCGTIHGGANGRNPDGRRGRCGDGARHGPQKSGKPCRNQCWRGWRSRYYSAWRRLTVAARRHASDRRGVSYFQYSASGALVKPRQPPAPTFGFAAQSAISECKTAPTQAPPSYGPFVRTSAVRLRGSRLFGHVVGLQRVHEILFRQHPVFEGQRMIGQLVAEHLVGVLPHHSPGYSRRERRRLFDGLVASCFHSHFLSATT